MEDKNKTNKQLISELVNLRKKYAELSKETGRINSDDDFTLVSDKLSSSEGYHVLAASQKIAHLGSWEWNIKDNAETWSDEQFRIFGYEPGEIEPTYDHFIEALNREDRSKVLAAVKNTLDGTKPFKIEFRIIRPDKTERTVIAQGEVERDNENNPVRMIGIVMDITERKQAEEKLLRISKAVESASDAIGMSDPLGNHFYHNRAFTELFGYNAKELDAAGGPPVVYADKSVAKEVFDNIMSGRSWNGEIEMVSKSGRKFPALARADAIKDEAQNIIGLIGIITDITERKKHEEQLRQIEEELRCNKNDLESLAGHLIVSQEKELRGLARELHDDITQRLAVLAIEAGSIEKDSKELPGPVLQKVARIKEQLIKMSKDVHDISRDIHPSILDDLGLERAIQSECGDFSSRTGIAVIFTPKNIPRNISKEISLPVYRIIQEGLANIVKHADTKNAYVFLEGSDDRLILAVRDTGVGFDHKKVRKMATLGLGGIRERARLIDGKSSIISNPGKGTTIEVSIPYKRRDA
jgi:two-component system, NarL family, sensor histidine kinase UhpB